jgi:hypothetical protein
MVPNCLENFIGVRCLTTNPKSGFWVNDLEGLNLKYAADIADSDHVSGLQFLKSKIDFATQLVMSDVTRYALPYFRMNSIVDELSIGEWASTNIAPAPLDRGIEIRIKQSRLLRIRVNSVKVKMAQVNFSHSLEITDGLNSYSWPFTTDSNGEAELFPDYFSHSNVIHITMNDTAINVNNSVVKTGCGCSSKNSQYIVATGWNGSSTASTTYGILANVNAECSQDEIACILSHKLALPILYRAGMEIVKEALTTDRLNSITLLDTEKGNFLLETFTNEFDKQMKTLMESIPQLMKRVDDCCVVCNQSRYVQGLP